MTYVKYCCRFVLSVCHHAQQCSQCLRWGVLQSWICLIIHRSMAGTAEQSRGACCMCLPSAWHTTVTRGFVCCSSSPVVRRYGFLQCNALTKPKTHGIYIAILIHVSVANFLQSSAMPKQRPFSRHVPLPLQLLRGLHRQRRYQRHHRCLGNSLQAEQHQVWPHCQR